MVVVKIMTIMVWLRKRKLMRARKTFQIAKREADRSLPAGWTRKRFAEIMRIEENYEWKMRKGDYIKQERQGPQSTSNIPLAPKLESKTEDAIYSLISTKDKGFLDLTGRFPYCSSRGNE